MEKRFLLIITGETFRDGPIQSRGRYTQKAYNLQKDAIDSQINFIENIFLNFSTKCEIFLNIYSGNTEYDNDLLSWYGKYAKYVKFNNELLGEDNLHENTLNYIKNNINFNEYDFMFFIRPDLLLKKYFNKIFKTNYTQITFAHINEITDPWGNNSSITEDGYPRVNHQIMMIPRLFYDKLLDGKIWKLHDSYRHSVLNGISSKDINFFLETYHGASTDIIWNPIFHQVGRVETGFWVDKKYRVCSSTHKPYIIDNETNPYE
jgi:hypothetical protein